MSRKLDAAIAEALGREVTWQRKVRTGGKKIKPVYTYYACSPDDKFAQLFYAGTEAEVPKFHKDGNAMLELDREMRGRGWRIELWYADAENVYVAHYEKPGDDFTAEGKAETEALARAFAACYALTGKEWAE